MNRGNSVWVTLTKLLEHSPFALGVVGSVHHAMWAIFVDKRHARGFSRGFPVSFHFFQSTNLFIRHEPNLLKDLDANIQCIYKIQGTDQLLQVQSWSKLVHVDYIQMLIIFFESWPSFFFLLD